MPTIKQPKPFFMAGILFQLLLVFALASAKASTEEPPAKANWRVRDFIIEENGNPLLVWHRESDHQIAVWKLDADGEHRSSLVIDGLTGVEILQVKPTGDRVWLLWEDADGDTGLTAKSPSGETDDIAVGPFEDMTIMEMTLVPDGTLWVLMEGDRDRSTIMLHLGPNGSVIEETRLDHVPHWWALTIESPSTGGPRLLWENYANGSVAVSRHDPTGAPKDIQLFESIPNDWILDHSIRADGGLWLLQSNFSDNSVRVVALGADGKQQMNVSTGPFEDLWPWHMEIGSDGVSWLLWEDFASGTVGLGRLDSKAVFETVITVEAATDWWIPYMREGAGGKLWLLAENHGDGSAALLRLGADGTFERQVSHRFD